MKTIYNFKIIILFSTALLFISCEDSIIDYSSHDNVEIKEVDPNQPIEPGLTITDTIYIIDQTGKRWNVSHAVSQYGFVAEQFQFGLGPDAIKPILNPEMLCPGDPGYPDDSDNMVVIGLSLEEPARAYPLNIMSTHEVANENIEDTHVAVAY